MDIYDYDYIQLLVIEYDVPTYNVAVRFHKILNGSARGSGGALLNLGSNSINDQEKVLMGTGYAMYSREFLLGLFKISPIDGTVSSIGIQFWIDGLHQLNSDY